jgi:hypothetical protein
MLHAQEIMALMQEIVTYTTSMLTSSPQHFTCPGSSDGIFFNLSKWHPGHALLHSLLEQPWVSGESGREYQIPQVRLPACELIRYNQSVQAMHLSR